MPITTQQEIALFQILEVPWQPVVMKPAGDDSLFFEQADATNSIRQARQRILSYLDQYVYPSPDALDMLEGYCNRWLAIGTDTVVMESGSTGSLAGVTSDPERERLEIQKQVRDFIPFYRSHLQIQRAGSSGPYVGIVR